MGISGTLLFVHNRGQSARYPVSSIRIGKSASRDGARGIIIAAAAILFLVLVFPVHALDWTTETVDSSGDVGWYTSLALDDSGNPRISYMDWTNRHLKYAAKVDGVWMNETVDSTNAVGEFSSLKLDPAAQPLISYYDANRGNLSFAMKSGDTWRTVIVDGGGVGRYTSLAVDGSGNPHICYQDLLNAKLKYAEKTADTWTSETVDNSLNVGAYSSLALDTSNSPHISYYDGTRGDLKYAVKNGGQWTNQTVDSTGNIGYYTSIDLDVTGNPHISYYDGGNRDLKYATKTGNFWTKEIVDTNGSVGKYTSLALDSEGNPCISYYDESNGHLKYAAKAGNVWIYATVDNAVNSGMYTSLALDGAGNPRISYRDAGNNDLKYAIGIPPVLLNFTASPRHGSAPLTVQFSDTSVGGLPSLWNWSFGDGTWFTTNQTALKNPVHVYEIPGKYSVTLTVQNFTIADTMTSPGYITVVSPSLTPTPTPVVTPSPTPSPAPTTTSTPTSSQTATPSPTVTSFPTPTVTPSPTPSPAPTTTSTPTPSRTATPSPTVPSLPTPTATPSPASSPVPTLTPPEGSGSDDPLLLPSSTSGQKKAGPLRCETVNVGGDSGIRHITVTGQDIADSIITARKVTSLPPGVPLMDIPVYQYIDVNAARCPLVEPAQIEFEIPLSSITAHHASVNTVSLFILNNTTWIYLPTTPTGSENGMVLFRAESRGFSLFAITLQNTTSIELQEGSGPVVSASDTHLESESRPRTVTGIPDTSLIPPGGVSNARPSFTTFFISIIGMIWVVLGTIVIGSWWIQR